MTALEVRGDVDARAVEQLKRCAEAGDAVAAVMCADGHVGYSQRRQQVRPGVVNWTEVQHQIAMRGIELRGGAADEAPEAYKRLDVVLGAHADTIRVLHRLQPIGVAMAAADVFDPFKD